MTNRTIPLLLLAVVLPSAAAAQGKPSAAIPATETTRAVSVSDLPSAQPAVLRHGDSQVRWNGAALSIDAGGDTLRNILIKVARSTGMKISGGVPDERVFGSYGPGNAQQILTDLFDGLSVNMVLLNGSPLKPKEMILSTRTGGVTPPSARPVSDAEYAEQQNDNPPLPQANGQAPVGHYPPNMVSPAGTPPFQMQNAPGQPVNDSTATQTGTDANGTPQSPNGTRTPEQIFEELRMRQQRTATQ